MPSLAVLVFFGIAILLASAWATLGVIYPQLSFRIENIFQLREVELSTFGLLLHKGGGLLALGLLVYFPISYDLPELLVAVPLGMAVPIVYCYRTYGVIMVQPLLDPHRHRG